MALDLKKFNGKRICVAVSGGVDSMVLLHLLKERQAEYGYTLTAVNFEHGIRGETSLDDSRFVAKACEELQIPLIFFQENCIARATREKESVETAARNFRREGYEKILNEGLADYIATAHHGNDEAETVIFRLCRGASLSGASAMKAEKNAFIRPLLDKTKTEILAYAEQKGIAYRQDETNNERTATRNVIRLDVLPVLEETISGATRNLSRFAAIAAEDDELLYSLSERLIKRETDRIGVSFSEQKPLFRRACLSAMKELGIEKDYTFLHLEDLYRLQGLAVGARITLPKGVEAKKEKNGVFFYRAVTSETEAVGANPVAFTIGETRFGEYEIKVTETPPSDLEVEKVLRFDADKLPDSCVFRTRREGDLFRKFGGGTTTLKRYLINKKIPREERDMPLVAEENGATVYAISGVEVAEEVKITNESKKVVYMTVKKYRR